MIERKTYYARDLLELGPDLGKIKADEAYEAYAEHYKKGYAFLTNGSIGSNARLYEETLRAKGFDFIKESRAFEHSGREDRGMVAFLVKEGENSKALNVLVTALEQNR